MLAICRLHEVRHACMGLRVSCRWVWHAGTLWSADLLLLLLCLRASSLSQVQLAQACTQFCQRLVELPEHCRQWSMNCVGLHDS